MVIPTSYLTQGSVAVDVAFSEMRDLMHMLVGMAAAPFDWYLLPESSHLLKATETASRMKLALSKGHIEQAVLCNGGVMHPLRV